MTTMLEAAEMRRHWETKIFDDALEEAPSSGFPPDQQRLIFAGTPPDLQQLDKEGILPDQQLHAEIALLQNLQAVLARKLRIARARQALAAAQRELSEAIATDARLCAAHAAEPSSLNPSTPTDCKVGQPTKAMRKRARRRLRQLELQQPLQKENERQEPEPETALKHALDERPNPTDGLVQKRIATYEALAPSNETVKPDVEKFEPVNMLEPAVCADAAGERPRKQRPPTDVSEMPEHEHEEIVSSLASPKRVEVPTEVVLQKRCRADKASSREDDEGEKETDQGTQPLIGRWRKQMSQLQRDDDEHELEPDNMLEPESQLAQEPQPPEGLAHALEPMPPEGLAADEKVLEQDGKTLLTPIAGERPRKQRPPNVELPASDVGDVNELVPQSEADSEDVSVPHGTSPPFKVASNGVGSAQIGRGGIMWADVASSSDESDDCLPNVEDALPIEGTFKGPSTLGEVQQLITYLERSLDDNPQIEETCALISSLNQLVADMQVQDAPT